MLNTAYTVGNLKILKRLGNKRFEEDYFPELSYPYDKSQYGMVVLKALSGESVNTKYILGSKYGKGFLVIKISDTAYIPFSVSFDNNTGLDTFTKVIDAGWSKEGINISETLAKYFKKKLNSVPSKVLGVLIFDVLSFLKVSLGTFHQAEISNDCVSNLRVMIREANVFRRCCATRGRLLKWLGLDESYAESVNNIISAGLLLNVLDFVNTTSTTDKLKELSTKLSYIVTCINDLTEASNSLNYDKRLCELFEVVLGLLRGDLIPASSPILESAKEVNSTQTEESSKITLEVSKSKILAKDVVMQYSSVLKVGKLLICTDNSNTKVVLAPVSSEEYAIVQS